MTPSCSPRYLSKATPSGWGSTIAYNTTVSWPNVSGALAETGNSGMVAGCKATPGCVAYVGISYLTQVLQAGAGYAELQNASGQYVLPSQGSIAAEAASFAGKTPANGTISLIYGPAKQGYPIINYEYGDREHEAVDSRRRPRTSGRSSSGRSTRSSATARPTCRR